MGETDHYLTVGEVIKLLQQYPEEMTVTASSGWNWGYVEDVYTEKYPDGELYVTISATME